MEDGLMITCIIVTILSFCGFIACLIILFVDYFLDEGAKIGYEEGQKDYADGIIKYHYIEEKKWVKKESK